METTGVGPEDTLTRTERAHVSRAYRNSAHSNIHVAKANQAIQALVRGLAYFGWRLGSPTAVVKATGNGQDVVMELTETPPALVKKIAATRMQEMQRERVEQECARRGITYGGQGIDWINVN